MKETVNDTRQRKMPKKQMTNKSEMKNKCCALTQKHTDQGKHCKTNSAQQFKNKCLSYPQP